MKELLVGQECYTWACRDLEHYRKLIDENNKLQWAIEAELAKEKPDAARS